MFGYIFATFWFCFYVVDVASFETLMIMAHNESTEGRSTLVFRVHEKLYLERSSFFCLGLSTSSSGKGTSES